MIYDNNIPVVYLYELDSVRSSPEEISYAQDALFEEIVTNGNRVVISLNQLTDSMAIMSLIQDEKIYPALINLFYNGWLCVSLYKNYRTASQYIQKAIEKCLDDKNNYNTFIFSALPVKSSEKNLLKCMLNVLRFNDLQLLDDEFKHNPNLFDDFEELNLKINMSKSHRIKFLKKFLTMILAISQAEFALNPRKSEIDKTLAKYIDDACKILSKNDKFHKAVSMIIELDKIISANDEQDLKNNRSVWYKAMQNAKIKNNTAKELDETEKIVKGVIDTAYNFQVENSINNVLKHYNENSPLDFEEEFLRRLNSYILPDNKRPEHKFNIYEDDWFYVPAKKLDWNTAQRVHENIAENRSKKYILKRIICAFSIPLPVFIYQLCFGSTPFLLFTSLILFITMLILILNMRERQDSKQDVDSKLKPQDKDNINITYEKFLSFNRKKWERQRFHSLGWRVVLFLVNSGLFINLTWLVEQIQDKFQWFQEWSWVTAILCFGFANSIIMLALNLPDILDSFTAFMKTIWDFCVTLFSKRRISYNKNYFTN